MWTKVFLLAAALALIGILYLVERFHRFYFLEQLAKKQKRLSWLLAALLVTGILSSGLIFNWYTMALIIIHLVLIWLLCDLIGWIIRKCRRKERTFNYSGGAALLLTFMLLTCGWVCMHHVFRTSYSFRSDKLTPDDHLRAVLLTDTHLSNTLDGEKFTELCERIQKEDPDLVLVCGDYVDDDSKKKDLIAASRALGQIQSTYGTYFAYGNHDPFANSRSFSDDDLIDSLLNNGVTILIDETKEIGDRFYLCGRRDFSDQRKAAQELTNSLDKSKYIIMMDHQPKDFDAEAEAGADLVLSGHTHGGHVFPAGQLGVVLGETERLYGEEKREDTEFLVSSGASGWEIPFKTGCISEYCVIDIAGE